MKIKPIYIQLAGFLSFIVLILCFIGLLSVAGAVDLDRITIRQAIIQGIIWLIILGLDAVGISKLTEDGDWRKIDGNANSNDY